jgi:hypothetical protein
MKNYWLTRTAKKKAIGEINDMLKKFVGESSDPIGPLVARLRQAVLAYFQKNREYVQHFLSDRDVNRIDYRFDIQKHMGKVLSVQFKEVEH